MTASSADRRRARRAGTRTLAAAAVALMAASAPALAQQQGPLRLFSLPQGQQAAPSAPGEQPVPQAIQPAAPRGLTGISVAPVDRLDLASAGLLDEGSGGLSYRLWQGTDAEMAAMLLAKLPPAMPSPAAHDLAYRLLASVAASPQPVAGAPALLPLRVEHLRLMGEAPAAARLAESVPEGERSELLRRALVDALLAQATGDALPAEVCPQAEDGVRRFESPYWQKVAAFCDLVSGRAAEAQLTLAMLRETGHEDAPFFWAADQLAGIKPAALKTLPAPNPLLLAMARAASRELPADAFGADAAPWLLAAVARHGPGGDRLAIAERAAATGALAVEDLARLYDAEEFAAAELTGPVGKAATARERARLHQSLARQMEPASLAAALEATRFSPLYPATARLYADRVAALPPLADVAAAAGRALFAAGRPDAARPWVQEARLRQDASPAAAEALRALWPYERVADAPAAAPFGPQMIAAWRATQPPGTPKPDLDRRHTLILGLLQALGEPVASADWMVPLTDATVDPAPVPDAAILRALDMAAAHGRIGETVALSVIALGNEGPAVVHPEALFRVVAALKRVGLEREAKGLALEAMAAAGV